MKCFRKIFFEKIKNGSYVVTATFTGMRPDNTQLLEISSERKGLSLETIYFKNADISLKM
ncbi:MAG: hypothetical protein ABI691_21730 [Ginsengibacter sp.]